MSTDAGRRELSARCNSEMSEPWGRSWVLCSLLILGMVWARAGGFCSLCFNFITYGLVFGVFGKNRLITSVGRTHSQSCSPQVTAEASVSPLPTLLFGRVAWFPGSDLWGVSQTVCRCCSVPLVKKEFHHGHRLGDAGSELSR